MKGDLTTGSISTGLLKFALPLMAGNILQQFYNLADTLIVGRVLGTDALAAVGSSYTLMTFLTSILIGLCMGSSAFFSMQFGRKKWEVLNKGIFLSFILIGLLTLILNITVYALLDWIIRSIQVPAELQGMIKDYLLYIFAGIAAVFLYNFAASLLRSVGNSFAPLMFLGITVVLNIFLDIFFVMELRWGIRGAAAATVISQFVSGIGIVIYTYLCFPMFRIKRIHMHWDSNILKNIFSLSFLTCLQQSVMNLGILMVQGLVNGFGTQNFGADKKERIRKGIRISVLFVFIFCTVVSLLVCLFAKPLMNIFVKAENHLVIREGVKYLRIEASFYFGIGLLFMLYGFYRAVQKPGMSVILTVCSLGTRVVLAYILSGIPALGVTGIWVSIPIGWILADVAGISYYRRKFKLASFN